jgi:hypothetical protein
MKPRNREINIFNLSMMDVICGALGAFLIMLVVLIPYYKQGAGAKTGDEAKRLKQELEQARRELEQAKTKDSKSEDASQGLVKENQQLKKQLADARQELNKSAERKAVKPGDQNKAEENLKKLSSVASSILTITAYWDSPNADVDLWVRYAAGVWGGPKGQTPDGKKLAQRLSDTRQGPGFETFIDPGAAGKYEVYYRMARRPGVTGAPVLVNARLSWLGLEFDKYSTEHWTAENKLTADGLTPAFMVSFGKDGIKLGPLSR